VPGAAVGAEAMTAGWFMAAPVYRDKRFASIRAAIPLPARAPGGRG